MDGRVADDYQGPVETEIAGLQADLEDAILDLLAAQFTLGRTVKIGAQTLASSGDIASLAFGEASGRQAITVGLTAGGSVGPTALNAVKVFDGATDLGELYKFADPALPKAGWNLLLVEDDSSLGIHNVSFVNTVLSSSRTAVQAVPEAGSLGSMLAAAGALAWRRRRRRIRPEGRPPA
jgi:hypothetical protein